MDKYKIEVTFTEQVLGAIPKDKDTYMRYVIGRAKKEGVELTEEQIKQEANTVEEMEETGWTGFHTKDGEPFEYDYVWLGFFKDACGMLRRGDDTLSAKIRAYKKNIDGLVFIKPRQIFYEMPDGTEMGIIERPLRASTPQGERVALARSDTLPVGTKMSFEVWIIPNSDVDEEVLREWLDYGALRGLRQWRNAGYGTFTYELFHLG